jgi:hypothetical protein
MPVRLIVAVLALATWVGVARADDVLHPGAVVLDRPTLRTAGIRLLVSGDDDHDARVAVRYRRSGDPAWRSAMDLFRVRPEHVVGRTVPEQFAGSIFELEPGATYDVELHATDPDGPVDATMSSVVTLRTVPGNPAHPAVRPVADADALDAALAAAQPGDVITLADGTYSGAFSIFASGTAADPIVIRGASTDGVVLDGRGCSSCNVLEAYGSFVHVERLTLQHANRALRFQGVGTEGNVARRLHVRDVRLGIAANPDQRDFYLCDNVVEGRLVWPHVYSDDGGAHSDDDGIRVEGDGHVVCHNVIAGFGDAMKIGQAGSRAVDFYGNEVLSAYDNGLELDGSEGNTRAFRNRFTNTYATLSFQPIYGGPAYALRNVVVNVANEQLKFHALGTTPPEEPSGMLVYHNTFVSPALALNLQTPATSHDFVLADNLFVGPSPPGARVVDWSSPIDDGTIDWNGWFPDGTFDFDTPGRWASFAAMQAAGVFESHGTLLAPPIFASGLAAPASYTVTLDPPDATLAAGANAVDAGVFVPNVDDGFTGAAPDLGALERGCPDLLFGVRPEGIDETNEPFGCGGPTVTTTVTTSTTTTTLPWVLVRTTKLGLRDDPARPERRRVAFKSSTRRDALGNRVALPAAGGPGDPTLGGATLVVYDSAGTGEAATVALPSDGWSMLGTPPAIKGYRFRSDDPLQPIASLVVRQDRIGLKGGKASWPYTLDEPAQGRIAVRLTLGSDRPWCAEAPARLDVPGRFVAVPATPPPVICPALP